MSDHVWVSTALESGAHLQPLTNDISAARVEDAVAAKKRNIAGEALPADFFPTRIFPAAHAGSNLPALGDFFFAGSYWVVSSAFADVLRKHELGGASLYLVAVEGKDGTPAGKDYFSLNFGNVKSAFSPTQSRNVREKHGAGFLASPMLADFDIACAADANDGPAIWIDPQVRGSFFVSGPLGDALAERGLAKRLEAFRRCRLV